MCTIRRDSWARVGPDAGWVRCGAGRMRVIKCVFMGAGVLRVMRVVGQIAGQIFLKRLLADKLLDV